ncbi:MAG: prepilin peptidase [Verrucomicrobiota bacterium]|nr:prepilin peptidase [Verrucomicrobiota bacterium]
MELNDILMSGPMMVVVFIFGACIGSFLNVVIYRLPRDLSVNSPRRSFCTTSGKSIPWYDNIPIVSYLMLKGKSRFDGQPISIRYPIVEVLTGVLFLWVWSAHPGNAVTAFLYLILTGFLIAGSGIDFEHYIIPDEITKTSIVMGIVLSAIWPNLHRTEDYGTSFGLGIWGALFGYGLLWIVGYLGKIAFKKDAMGMGDMKLLAGIGAFLGAQAVLFSLVIASFAGAAVGLSLVAGKKKELSTKIPFGPYLSFGAYIWMVGGDRLWDWYLRTLIPSEEVAKQAIGLITGF